MEWLLAQLTSLDSASVYLFLGGILLACGLGMPIPEDISLIVGGYMAHLGVVNVHLMFLISIVAVLGGDSIGFFAGRYFGQRILETVFARRFLTKRRQLRVRAYFRRYGSKVIFIARFLPGLRFSIFVSAGMLRVRPSIFLLYDSLAAAVSVPFLVYLAWIFGDKIDLVIHWARRSEYGILALVALALILAGIKLYFRGRRKRQLAALAVPPPSEIGGSSIPPAR